MKAENYFSANADLTFYYDAVIDWRRLVPLFAEPEDAQRPDETGSSWREVLGGAGDFVGRQVSQRAAEVDRLGTPHKGDIKVSPPMADNLRGLADLGLIGLGFRASSAVRGCPSPSTRASSRCLLAPIRRRWSSTPSTRARRR